MKNTDKIIYALENEENELWLRAKVVLQFIELRNQLGYSQQNVADRMGCSKQLISRFERMENSPTLSFLVNYAKTLNADLNTILSMKDVRELSLDENQMIKMNHIITYSKGEISIDVNFDYEKETIWLTQAQIATLFEVDRTRITRHIKNILEDGELEQSVCAENALTASDGKKYRTKLYNLDMIISIGYRVNSKRGIEFRKWATNILKEYMFKGYAINKKRLNALNKTIEMQNKMISASLSVDSKELRDVINEYTMALEMLDNFDHQSFPTITGRNTIYRLQYDECRRLIDSMKFKVESNLFGVEKEFGKLNGILDAVYQSAFGEDVYKTVESKAAHLLYFLVKDHPFVDGCKRIAATIFMEFLNKNHMLIKNGALLMSNDTLAIITLLVAESSPDEMDLIINVIMSILNKY